jgi:hypothetical protein
LVPSQETIVCVRAEVAAKSASARDVRAVWERWTAPRPVCDAHEILGIERGWGRKRERDVVGRVMLGGEERGDERCVGKGEVVEEGKGGEGLVKGD